MATDDLKARLRTPHSSLATQSFIMNEAAARIEALEAQLAARDSLVTINWQPIETLPFGRLVMLYFRGGEKGCGEIDCNWVYEEDGGRWGYWTWGGPNSGSDFDRDEKPVLWADAWEVAGKTATAIASGDYAKGQTDAQQGD